MKLLPLPFNSELRVSLFLTSDDKIVALFCDLILLKVKYFDLLNSSSANFFESKFKTR